MKTTLEKLTEGLQILLKYDKTSNVDCWDGKIIVELWPKEVGPHVQELVKELGWKIVDDEFVFECF